MTAAGAKPRSSLRRAAFAYFAIDLVAAFTLVSLVSLTLYRGAIEHQAEMQTDRLVRHLRDDVALAEERWAKETNRIREVLEVSGFAERSTGRQARLDAFFKQNALHPLLGYAVFDGDQLVYRDGLAAPQGRQQNPAGWVHDAASGGLFRLIAVPLGLAAGQQGQLVVAWPVDASVLREMLHDVDLELLWRGTVVTRVDSSRPLLDAVAWPKVARSLPWSEELSGEPAMLRLYVVPDRVLAPLDIALWVTAAFLVFVLVIWKTLGRWVAAGIKRLRRLELAVHEFRRSAGLSPAVRASLDRANPASNDELGSVISAVCEMMESVERERGETQRHLEQLLSISLVQGAFSRLESPQDFFALMLDRALLTCEGRRGLLAEYHGNAGGKPTLKVLASSLGNLSCNAACIVAEGGEELGGCAMPTIDLVLERGEIRSLSGCICEQTFAVPLKSNDRVCGVLLVMEVHDESALGRNWMLWETCGHLIEATRNEIERRELVGELMLANRVFEHSSEAIVITDPKCNIVRVNPAFSRLTGYSAAEAIGNNPKILQSGRHDQEFYASMWREINDKGQWAGELVDRRKDGSVYPKWLSINVLRDVESGRISHYLGMFSDISVIKESQRRVEHLAYHDSLTDLPNRTYVSERIGKILEHASRRERMVALMIIDLDRFKHINDSLGHATGDRLLREVAARLPPLVREHDIVARFGGDEFVVVLADVENRAIVERVAQKMMNAVATPVEFEAYSLHVTPSIGIAVFPSDGADAATLLREADAAMYYAKDGGRNQMRFFSGFMDEAARERLSIEQGLREALGKGELELHYQPQVSADGLRVLGFEALMRWRHPLRGWVSPASFIPVAEETGLIIEIGNWALREACVQAKQWLDLGWPEFTIGVNLSAQQFERDSLTATISRVLAETALPSKNLEIEITESCLVQNPQLVGEQLRAVRALGVAIAVDDFGTGYSSLSYLRTFALDRLKIDRSFVADVISDPSAAAIATAIVSLAAILKLDTIAEGVETAGQLAFLRRAGCQCIQGYYYSKPLPASLIPDFVRRHTELLLS